MIVKLADRINNRPGYLYAFKSGTGSIGKVRVLILASVLAISTSDLRAEEVGQQTGNIGDAQLYTSIRFGIVNSDNAFRSSNNLVNNSGFRVAPSATVVANRRGLKITAGYAGAFAEFKEGALNYNDHNLSSTVEAVLGSRKRFSASTSLTFRHEELGVGLTRGTAEAGDEQVEASDFIVDANYLYGASTAMLNLTGGLLFQNTAFQNRSDLTNGRDYSRINPYGRLSYRLSADTRALFEVGVGQYDFDNNLLDRSVVQALVGLSFQGTGKTLGQLKVGVAANDYSAAEVDDTVILIADVGLTFSPSSLSQIVFNFNRQINNEEGINISTGGAQTINDSALISWRKSWSGFSKSVAYLGYGNQSRDCPASGTQNLEVGLEFSVLPKRWLEVGAGITSRNVTADDCGEVNANDLEYDLNEFLAFVRIFP